MKIKITLLILFILLNTIVYTVTEFNKQQRISKTLHNDLFQLQNHYETLLYHQKIDNKIIMQNLKMLSYDILIQLPNSSEEQLNELRKKLYKKLKKRYELIKQRGVYQLQFVLPNNKSFLRVHRPEKYNDDLTGIRYSYEYVNANHKPIEGFESGKTTHAYRYVYPIFDKQGNYLCALEISYSSNYLQDYLTKVSKLHTHFLIHKHVFDENVWKNPDSKLIYQQSAEHDDFKLTMTQQHTFQNCIINNKFRLKDIKNDIKTNMNKQKPFVLYTQHINVNNEFHQHDSPINIDIISFYPIKSITGNVQAWLVSYKPNSFIAITILGNTIVRIFAFILFSILFYFSYKVVTQQQKLKEQKDVLEAKTNQLSDYIHSTTDFLWEVDSNGVYTYVSEGAEDLLGYTPEEMIGKTPFDFMKKHEKRGLLETFLNIIEHKKPIKNLENWNIAKNGEDVCLLTNGVPMYEKGEFIGYRGTDRDITEQKYQLQTLHEQSKMASMGEMIGNIAHQWRQPLNVITTSASGIKLRKELGLLTEKELYETLDDIKESGIYLSKTIDTFRDFIKEDKKEHTVILQERIDKALGIISASLKTNHIQLINNIDYSNPIEIKLIIGELSQVIMNIINNAKDILLEKSTPDPWIKIALIEDENKIILTIEDNGGGIPESNIDRIFEPYFTTKHESIGTGLGLFMSYKIIVESLKGKLYVQNTSNGAKFFIELNK